MNSNRILSIDLFRGLTIFMMVFVNDVAGVANIPPWMKHVAADYDGMTFVDVVFPAFLFIVGMAIPFAVEARLKKGKGLFDFWKHVLFRTFGLLVLGVYMVNSGEMNTAANPIPKYFWAPSFYIAAVLIWNRYPKTKDQKKQNIFTALQILGIIILVLLYFLFRKGDGDQLIGMTPSWWGILGLIGWAYLYSMIVYMLSKQRLIGVSIASLLFLILHVGIWLGWVDQFAFLKGQNGNIAHSILVLAGIICSLILKEGGVKSFPNSKIRNIVLFGLTMAVIAYFVRPLTGGISKIGATPSWVLYCSAIYCFIFPLIYWLVDLKGISAWGNFLKPAGKNPLLTYILPPFFYGLVGFGIYPAVLSNGFLGVIRSLVFALVVLWVAKWMTKKGIVLKL